MIINIQASEISASEILEKLTPEAKDALKGKKAVAYIIAEEGVSRPRVVGEGNATLHWPRAVVHRVAEFVKKGTKLFDRHNADSSHTDRPSIGEVVSTFTRAVGDKLQAVAVGVLTGERPELDVCSIEADVRVDSAGTVGDVDAVTGIALSSSKVDSPAFAGARRLATLQCFAEAEDNKGKETPMTFQEVQAFIREHNVFPRQLFGIDDIRNDRDFGPLLKAGDDAKTALEALKVEKGELEKKSAEAVRANSEIEAKDRFAKLIPEGATEKQKAFYLRRFDPKRLEKLDDAALAEYLKKEETEYAETAKLLGVTDAGAPPVITPKPGESKAAEADAVSSALSEVMGGKA